MTKHTLVMKTPDFFMLRDYLVQKRQQGVFDNNKLLMDFYKAFAVEAYIELPRKVKNLNGNCVVIFYLENNHRLITEIGLFCKEQIAELKSSNPELSYALNVLKNYMASSLMDFDWRK